MSRDGSSRIYFNSRYLCADNRHYVISVRGRASPVGRLVARPRGLPAKNSSADPGAAPSGSPPDDSGTFPPELQHPVVTLQPGRTNRPPVPEEQVQVGHTAGQDQVGVLPPVDGQPQPCGP